MSFYTDAKNKGQLFVRMEEDQESLKRLRSKVFKEVMSAESAVDEILEALGEERITEMKIGIHAENLVFALARIHGFVNS